jgi:hypothetical protein
MNTLIVTYKKPYSINPLDKYVIVKYPASNVMNEKSYTLFTKVKIHPEDFNQVDAGILVRPGMHSGFVFAKPNFIKFGFWFDYPDKDSEYREILKELSDNELNDFIHLIAIDNMDERKIKIFVNKEFIGELWYPEGSTKHNYAGTHYYFGVCNPYIIARPYDQYGSFTFTETGLLDFAIEDINILNNISDHITQHPRLEYNIFKEDYQYKKNFVFYYDFENISNYKIWDVSENNNYLCKLLDRDNNVI